MRHRLRLRVALWLSSVLLGTSFAIHRREADPFVVLFLLVALIALAATADHLLTREHRS